MVNTKDAQTIIALRDSCNCTGYTIIAFEKFELHKFLYIIQMLYKKSPNQHARKQKQYQE